MFGHILCILVAIRLQKYNYFSKNEQTGSKILENFSTDFVLSRGKCISLQHQLIKKKQ